MQYENIVNKALEFSKRKNDTKEKVYEFEFYHKLSRLLDVIDSFDMGVRKIDFTPDVNQLVKELGLAKDLFENNLKFLKRG